MAATIFKNAPNNRRHFTFDFVEHVEFLDCGFDYNGAVGGFNEAITSRNTRKAVVSRCEFFDSNPEIGTYSLGTGDGEEVTFALDNMVFADRMIIPGTVQITDGVQSISDRGQLFGDLTGDGSGFVDYGDNNGRFYVSVTFDSAPEAGADIVLTFGRCDQRMGPQFLDCDQIICTENRLTAGARIHIRRPSRRSIITNNYLFGVNDNGLSLVEGRQDNGIPDAGNHIIQGNIIFYPATSGIFVGIDGESEAANNTASSHKSIV